ncbi:phosphotransferase [Rhodococcus sp. APC 3903]|uniref:phosphotransferase enzyme family protein n=1 Tax=Rhodococcus sp. APC 3903 TaxID=3035193 RepID=UPI0025B3AADF|nr:phosphotransferase [Rhodococcus sp. APC 3903]MDN3460708.1 phosphotransferase [Rhodococcus sp. APC 3903]
MSEVSPVTASATLLHAEAVLALALPRFGYSSDLIPEQLPVSENVSYRIRPEGRPAVVVRISRPGGHPLRVRESELAWLASLGQSADSLVPAVHSSLDGKMVITVRPPGSTLDYHVSLFECVEGQHPAEDDFAAVMPTLGTITAHLHEHATRWQRPTWFTRPDWDLDAAFGTGARWGDWRAGVDDIHEVEHLTRVESFVRRRLQSYGSGADRYGLIHADLRAANLLVNGERCRLIDFDDCGPGWFMYDLATALTFAEDHARSPEFIGEWLDGYRSVRELSVEHEREIDTFLLMRRMLTIAFLGNNPDIAVSREMLPGLARRTCDWSEGILNREAASL